VKSIQEFVPHAQDGTCGWHIAFQGWKRHGPTNTCVVTRHQRDRFDLFKTHVCDWLCSWMTPGCAENADEHSNSKELLFSFLNSRPVLEVCGGNHGAVHQVICFVRNNVIPHEKLCLAHLKKKLRCLDVKTSSCHEGTNFGMKHHAAGIRPDQKTQTSGHNLALQGSLKSCQIETDAAYMASSKCLWSTSPTADHVVTLVESILCRSFTRVPLCSVNRTGHGRWEVPFTAADDEIGDSDQRKRASKFSPIPNYARVRIVKLVDGFLTCECCTQERCGCCCVHTMAVFHQKLRDSPKA
jgi:hypothetical protein